MARPNPIIDDGSVTPPFLAIALVSAAALGYDAERLYNVEEGTPVWIQAKLPTDAGE